jgi:hypothetical protein
MASSGMSARVFRDLTAPKPTPIRRYYICWVLKGKYKSTKGYTFRYASQ